jgi:hypothetical protein
MDENEHSKRLCTKWRSQCESHEKGRIGSSLIPEKKRHTDCFGMKRSRTIFERFSRQFVSTLTMSKSMKKTKSGSELKNGAVKSETAKPLPAIAAAIAPVTPAPVRAALIAVPVAPVPAKAAATTTPPPVASVAAKAAPVVPVATPVVTEKPKAAHVLLELLKPEAKRVCVAGSFNEWQPDKTPLVKMGNGRWVGDLAVKPGKHEYLFVVDGQWLPDPNAKESVENPFGGRNSVLTVSA